MPSTMLSGFLPLISSWVVGVVLFYISVTFITLRTNFEELRQIRGVLLTLRVMVLIVCLLQLPLFYAAISFPCPVEQPLTAYGSQGESWLYYLGRPGSAFIGAVFGAFSELHVAFRYMSSAALLMAAAFDSISYTQLSDRHICLLSGRCPQRSIWSSEFYLFFIERDLIEMVAIVWALCLQAFLLCYIGCLIRPYYSFRQISLGIESNRLLMLQQQFAKYFPHDYEVNFGKHSDFALLNPDYYTTKSTHFSGRKRGPSGPIKDIGNRESLEPSQQWMITGEADNRAGEIDQEAAVLAMHKPPPTQVSSAPPQHRKKL